MFFLIPTPHTSGSTRTFVILIAIVVIFAIVLAGAVFLTQFQHTNDVVEAPIATVSEESQPETETTQPVTKAEAVAQLEQLRAITQAATNSPTSEESYERLGTLSDLSVEAASSTSEVADESINNSTGQAP